MKTLRNPLLWIIAMVMLTLSAFAQEIGPAAPATLAQSLEGWIIGLAVDHPWIVSVLVLVGTLRILIKPLMTFARLAVGQTASAKDDAILDAVERSWIYTAFLFLLDWLASIKLPAKSAATATDKPSRGRAFLFMAFILLPSTFILASCGALKPSGAIDTTYGADGTVTASTGLDIGTNATVVGSGSYNVATGNWTAGISIVFKDELSAAAAASELAAYNIGPAPYTRSGLEWKIAKFDRKSAAQLTTIEVALKNGATLKGL